MASNASTLTQASDGGCAELLNVHKGTVNGSPEPAGASDVVYWLKSKGKNYIGYTNNLTRRLRQHNGEQKGGALRTKTGVWYVHKVMSGFESKRAALRFEFALKLKKTDEAKHRFIGTGT